MRIAESARQGRDDLQRLVELLGGTEVGGPDLSLIGEVVTRAARGGLDVWREQFDLADSAVGTRFDHQIDRVRTETIPDSGLLPQDRVARAHCRAICGEMHSGFASLRSALTMNLKGDFPGHKVWARAKDDIERVTTIWRECLTRYGGPYLFGAVTMADAMYAPVVTRFRTYDVKLDAQCTAYCESILALPDLEEWIEAAKLESEDIDELDMEF